MALDKDAWGALLLAKVQAVGVTAGTPISPTQLLEVWKAIADADKTHITGNADIDLQAADISVPAAGLLDSLVQPVTGQASSAAVLLPTRIK